MTTLCVIASITAVSVWISQRGWDTQMISISIIYVCLVLNIFQCHYFLLGRTGICWLDKYKLFQHNQSIKIWQEDQPPGSLSVDISVLLLSLSSPDESSLILEKWMTIVHGSFKLSILETLKWNLLCDKRELTWYLATINQGKRESTLKVFLSHLFYLIWARLNKINMLGLSQSGFSGLWIRLTFKVKKAVGGLDGDL